MKNKKLEKWQSIVQKDESQYSGELIKIEARERIFAGKPEIEKELTTGDLTKETPHVRNITAENIECQVTTEIPHVKVTALNPEENDLAILIEDFIANEMDRLPFEELNDQAQRTVPVQGAGFYYLDWDNAKGTHTTMGANTVTFLHPKQVIPQDGITASIAEMDHISLRIPQTDEFIKRRYGVDVFDEKEDNPEIRSATGDTDSADHMVTEHCVFYRNKHGGIGKYSYVCDTELVDMEDYQARHIRRCRNCGAPEPMETEPMDEPTLNGEYPIEGSEPFGGEFDFPSDEEIIHAGAGRGRCPYCGGTYKDSTEEFFEAEADIVIDKEIIARAGEKIPFYKPDMYPIIIWRNISKYGSFLGDSDVDKIADQQNSTNRLEAKVLDQLLGAGSYISLPDSVSLKKDSADGKVIRPGSPANKAMIGVYDMTCDISPALAALEQYYKESQQELGITDSLVGRKDPTATSGKAKEFSAAQAAGRLESKRVMQRAAFANIGELLFKNQLAFCDEQRPVAGKDVMGNDHNQKWNKYLFLKRDAAGELYWNTDFLFSVDATESMSQNRSAMWQEIRSHFESGAFGDPSQISTQIMYWTLMEQQHYPGAGTVRKMMKEVQTQQLETQKNTAQAQKDALEEAKAAVPDIPGGVMNANI